MQLAILPGHSRETDNAFRLEEHLACMEVCMLVWDLLEAAGLELWHPPDSLFLMSNDLSLNTRVHLVNQAHQVDPIPLALELHLNGGGGSYSCALHHFSSSRGEIAATLLADRFSLAFPWEDRGALTPEDLGRSGLAWLSRTKCPAVIAEPGFLDNAGQQWDSGLQRVRYAVAVVDGVLAFLQFRGLL
jgi:N-acetylmuramoyl-L-alanine amidase